MSIKVLIAVPTPLPSMCSRTASCIMTLISYMQSKYTGVNFHLEAKVWHNIYQSRNYFATRFLDDESLTHLLFVDSDMVFEPEVIEAMFLLGEPVCGTIYPKREIDFSVHHMVSRRIDDPEKALSSSLNYVCGVHDFVAYQQLKAGSEQAFSLEHRNGFVQTHTVGTGLMLIKREVMETLLRQYVHLYLDEPGDDYRDMGLEGGVFQIFNTLKNEQGQFVGEDVAFCRRWEAVGGAIWAKMDAKIGHIGLEIFEGTYQYKLESMLATGRL